MREHILDDRQPIGQLLPLMVATAWSSVRLLYIHFLPDGLRELFGHSSRSARFK
jgi:hypothetical protein